MPYKTFVIRFPNPYARDRLLESSPQLCLPKANDTFWEGGNISVYVQPLWHSEVHSLLTQALRTIKSHSYARPIVVNLVVCLHETPHSRPIAIYSEQELYRILPPPKFNSAPLPQILITFCLPRNFRTLLPSRTGHPLQTQSQQQLRSVASTFTPLTLPLLLSI